MLDRAGSRRRLLALASAVALAGCGDAAPEVTIVIDAPGSTELLTGDFLTLTVTTSASVPLIEWTTSDDRIAEVVNGVVEARRPGSVTIGASAPEALGDEIVLSVVQRPGGYTAEEIDYFAEIAFGAEFGTSSAFLRRWRAGSGPLIRINGSPTTDDRVVLDSVIAEINRLAPLDIQIVADFPTVEMHFVPQSEFQNVLPQAPTGNNGIVWLWWDGTDHLFQSVVLISTDMSDPLRAHVIREEITQMLGLLQDSFLYPESIFYQQFSTVTEYLPIDRVVIDLLYRDELDTGMTPLEASQVARTLQRTDPLGAPSATPPVIDGKSVRPPSWWWSAVDPGFALERGRAGSAGGAGGR